MSTRTEVEFEVDGGVKLRGWLFVPPGEGRRPAITMAHGYAGVKELPSSPSRKPLPRLVSSSCYTTIADSGPAKAPRARM